MGKTTRFGVSLDDELLTAFDKLCRERGYSTRSEAIRDLVRQALNQEQWGGSDICGGTLTLVYDHHQNDLSRRLMAIQHEAHDAIVATMHVHLDHHTCLECLALKGEPPKVRSLANRLIACKGVKYGVFNRAPNAGELA